jgi:hypothetical protein
MDRASSPGRVSDGSRQLPWRAEAGPGLSRRSSDRPPTAPIWGIVRPAVGVGQVTVLRSRPPPPTTRRHSSRPAWLRPPPTRSPIIGPERASRTGSESPLSAGNPSVRHSATTTTSSPSTFPASDAHPHSPQGSRRRRRRWPMPSMGSWTGLALPGSTSPATRWVPGSPSSWPPGAAPCRSSRSPPTDWARRWNDSTRRRHC